MSVRAAHSLFRLFAKRYFVFSFFRVAFFFFISSVLSFHRAITTCRKTKKNKKKKQKTKWHKAATISKTQCSNASVRLETGQKSRAWPGSKLFATLSEWAMWWNDQKYRAFFHSFNDIAIACYLALSATKCRIIWIMSVPNCFIKSQRDCYCPFKV